jgi:hypothetical protein
MFYYIQVHLLDRCTKSSTLFTVTVLPVSSLHWALKYTVFHKIIIPVKTIVHCYYIYGYAVPEEVSHTQINNTDIYGRHITCVYPKKRSKMNEMDA